MAINTMTTAADALKRHYAKSMKELAFKTNPTLDMLPKRFDWGGTNNHVPVQVDLGESGLSANYASGSALGLASGSITFAQFAVTTVPLYVHASVAGELFLASKHSPDAFMDASKRAIDSALQAMANNTSRAIFRDGYGVLARLSSTAGVTGATATMSNARDTKNIEVGMEIRFSAAADGTGLKNDARRVTAVNRSAGTITVSPDLDVGGTTAAVNDYIYRAGNNAAELTGFAGWIPGSGSPAALFGVTRSTDRERLAGVFYDGSSQSLVEAFIDGIATGVDIGAQPDVAIVSSQTFANLAKELNSQAFQQDMKRGEVGFGRLVVHTAAGPIELIGDRSCPDGIAYCLKKDTWYIACRGPKLFNIDDRDGNIMRLNSSNDQLDIKFFTYYQLICDAPIRNIRIALPTS